MYRFFEPRTLHSCWSQEAVGEVGSDDSARLSGSDSEDEPSDSGSNDEAQLEAESDCGSQLSQHSLPEGNTAYEGEGLVDDSFDVYCTTRLAFPYHMP